MPSGEINLEMAKAIISIDQDNCDGCEECVLSCPSEVLEIIDGKAAAVRVEDCVVCRTCEEICPQEAITVSKM